MKITIVTVCFNAEAHIKECLESVAGQMYPEVEHILVDGGSRDRTVDILRGYRHISQLVSEPDDGIYDAMNKGLMLATGDYVLFLNADDTLPTSETIASSVSEIQANPGGDVYYGWLEVRKLDGEKVVFRPPAPAEAPVFMVCGCLPHQATLAKPSVFHKTGTFDLRYRYHADYDWFLKILADPTIDVRAINCVIGSFREGGASSQLAKGQPEVYAIQNASPLYASGAWDKRRITEYQNALLNERIENARLRSKLHERRTIHHRALQQIGKARTAVRSFLRDRRQP
jgi:glycosyltransferase involved in cell wall biosynthesis